MCLSGSRCLGRRWVGSAVKALAMPVDGVTGVSWSMLGWRCWFAIRRGDYRRGCTLLLALTRWKLYWMFYGFAERYGVV